MESNSAEYLTEKQVAGLLGLAPKTLQRQRLFGSGPPYRKLGSGLRAPVRYSRSELEAWIRSCPSGGYRSRGDRP